MWQVMGWSRPPSADGGRCGGKGARKEKGQTEKKGREREGHSMTGNTSRDIHGHLCFPEGL
ncbi:hypothetical protein F7725_002265 [Dissostichus mawsoni]|uniref:Uncharacterized protein n=1 Tax=Dissostichus mawsoni TaxID=36200 RepID=A0A7J5Y1Y1_DISMA|nr:hypothetical protein F7725_002265 [Dissostichus mawsoni]